MKRFFTALALLALVLALLLPAGAGAQDNQGDANLVVLQTATSENENGADLKVYVTLRDRNGEPIQGGGMASVNEGSFTLGNDHIKAAVGPATDPIKIALVIDASGSMNLRDRQGTPLIDQVREAAKNMIDAAPPNAEFVVYSFSDQVQRLNEGFLRRRDQADIAKDAINIFKINRPNTGDTCLYDAASQAIDGLIAAKPAPTERLSVILFTDGRDREAGGKTCASTIGATEVIHKALGSGEAPIPIYTIGVCANDRAPAGDNAAACKNVNSAELTTLAKETRAFPAIGQRDQLGQLFTKIMNGLSSQWVVQANVCPNAGRNVALLEVKSGDTVLNGSVPFTATRTCLPPPTFQISGLSYVSATDSYTVTMALGSPQRIKQLTAGVFDDAEGGTQVGSPQNFDTLSSRLQFGLPSAGMMAGKDYFMRITAVGSNSQPILGDKGSPVVATYKFTYNPTLDFQISSADVDWDADKIVVAVKVRGAGGRTLTFDGALSDSKTGQSEPLAATAPEDGKLHMAVPPMLRKATEARDYTVTINLALGGATLTRSVNRQLTPRPAQPSGPPWMLISLLATLVIGAIGAFMLARRRAQAPAIPAPYSDMTQLRPTPQPAVRPAQSPSARPVPKPPAPAPNGQQLVTVAGATELHAPESHTEVATRMGRRLRLRVVQTPAPGLAHEQVVSGFPFVIGREHGGLTLPGDAKVSGRHLQIDEADGGFRLTDLGSRNGTWVGERRLQPGEPLGVDAPVVVRLGPNTTIELGPGEG